MILDVDVDVDVDVNVNVNGGGRISDAATVTGHGSPLRRGLYMAWWQVYRVVCELEAGLQAGLWSDVGGSEV